MQIQDFLIFRGKNVYSHKPVIKMIVDIGDVYDTPTKDIKGFNEKIIELFPGIKEHYCSLGYKGGFVERLKEGTYIGHVTEHLILELQGTLGYQVFYGKTRVITEPSLYYIVFEYGNEAVAVQCAKDVVKIVNDIINHVEFDINQILANLRRIKSEYELGPSTKAIYDEAKKRGIPVIRLGNESVLQLGYGKYSRMVEAAITDSTSCISVDIAGNKQLTKQILINNNIPVPIGDMAYSEDDAIEVAESIGYPVVLKPYNGNQGKGVTVNINDEEQLRKAYSIAAEFSSTVIIEKHIRGKDYRILVVGDKVAAVAERQPPYVKGDGIHTVKQLIEIENTNSLRGEEHEKPLTKIKMDNVTKQVLEKSGYSDDYIPQPGFVINLRENANLSTGGTSRDCTNLIHPYNAALAVKAAKAIGLDIAGIDVTAGDIAVPLDNTNGAVIEVNAAPGLRMHLNPAEGQPVNIASDIVELLFPKGTAHSIPIAAVTGTNGKTTTTRLIRHVLTLSGKLVGMTTTSGVCIGNECIVKGDCTGPSSAKMVLSNKRVEAAVLETARGGIVKRGLGYENADVGVILNISDDHIGLDGLNNLEDLAHIKSLVIEAVKPDGYSVINADDKMAEYFIKRAKGNILLFSKENDNPLVIDYLSKGGKAVVIFNDTICICHNKTFLPLIDIGQIPITFDGLVECNIENSLAAVSALFALGIDIATIRKGLMSFKPDSEMNPGRFNIFDLGDFKVMLDYSHNIAGYNEVARFIQRLDAERLVGVIGMPGDRSNNSIEEVGKLCGKVFSQIYVKEDRDLRNRKPGEVAQLLYDSIIKDGFKRDNIEIINSELKAFETSMLDAQQGDLIVLCYEEFEPALDLVTKIKQELRNNKVRVRAQRTLV